MKDVFIFFSKLIVKPWIGILDPAPNSMFGSTTLLCTRENIRREDLPVGWTDASDARPPAVTIIKHSRNKIFEFFGPTGSKTISGVCYFENNGPTWLVDGVVVDVNPVCKKKKWRQRELFHNHHFATTIHGFRFTQIFRQTNVARRGTSGYQGKKTCLWKLWTLSFN